MIADISAHPPLSQAASVNRTEIGGVSPTPETMDYPIARRNSVTIVYLRGVADSMVARGVLTQRDLDTLIRAIENDREVARLPALSEEQDRVIIREAAIAAEEVMIDYLRRIGPNPQPGESLYTTALRRFIPQIESGTMHRAIAHIQANLIARQAGQ